MANITGRPIPQKPEKAKKDPERMHRVKQLPCVICGAPPPSDAHHCISGRYSQRKAPDSMTVPLCKRHHQEGPDAIHNDKAGWEARYGKDTDYLAEVDDMLATWF